ncbi:MAG: VOC family protein [Acidimicrobiia bacterium]|nr:VOC family protein [Acidimicrobiia bacterium]
MVEPFGFLAHGADRKVTLWLQRVPEEKAGKNRVHLDFVAGDMEAAVTKVESLGGTAGERHTWHDFVWTMCRDPEGNVFDIMQAQPPTAE